MNADHRDALILLARVLARIESQEATMTAVDHLGFHLRLKTQDAMRGARKQSGPRAGWRVRINKVLRQPVLCNRLRAHFRTLRTSTRDDRPVDQLSPESMNPVIFRPSDDHQGQIFSSRRRQMNELSLVILTSFPLQAWSANTSGGSLRRFCSAWLFPSGFRRSWHGRERKSRRGSRAGSYIWISHRSSFPL
jgi:hypothetical protein